ncbi:MAG: hypothetical protein LBN95_00075 [Prevotellaceae bacterium]|jgi:hypothetical protein|nr:hypothetical protein [Prevotellaceae bacterium]
MELIFNELSIKEFANQHVADETLQSFAKTAAEARQKGFRHIRSHIDKSQILYSGCNISKTYKDLLFGMIITPFIKDEDTEIVDNYIVANYYFENLENGFEKTSCVGLAGAYLYDTLSISLPTHQVWNNHKLPILIEKNNNLSTDFVFNVSAKESFNIQEIADFIENNSNVSLIGSKLQPYEKQIALRDDHGKDKLQEFANKIIHNEYVVEIINSLPFNPKSARFIKNIYKNGKIELVLYKEDKGLGMIIQTTGRNYRETEAIAKILEEKFY